ncbi:hypothetical protein BOX15_Mlig014365g1 [Macrostomum lignano]|uniref:Uncharacterized protein n=1 Tax=Macrostomum lignano TaxID=282301 RepID=A0A267DK66_9PLAT|nr:hypothetical protein BOX15_Mlig014365g1 [Macrostomum lignano]
MSVPQQQAEGPSRRSGRRLTASSSSGGGLKTGWLRHRLRRLSLPSLLAGGFSSGSGGGGGGGGRRRRRRPRSPEQPLTQKPQQTLQPPISSTPKTPEIRVVPPWRPLSNAERHRINLLYHLLRDHTDALRLCSLSTAVEGEEDTVDAELLSSWLGVAADELLDEFGDDDEVWTSGGSECDCECDCEEEDEDCFRLKKCKCDSDSCHSGHSGCSKRFKHQRRTERWNQEYDREYRKTVGLWDRNWHIK